MVTGHIQAAHWPQFRPVFKCRHINRQWQQQAAVRADGGTKLWPVVHWLRHYWAISVCGSVMSCHLTLGRFDKMLHLSWSVLKTPCAHNITFSYSCFLELSHVSVILWLHQCACVYVCVIKNSTLLSPNRLFVLHDHKHVTFLNKTGFYLKLISCRFTGR